MASEHYEGGAYLPMDMTSLYYFQELTKDLHMTRTAERLFISQQTLSNHILRLEKLLDCQLFYRKPSLSLTSAGEQVLAFAERTIREQANLQNALTDVADQKRGFIRFGASTLRLNACLPVILPKFSAEYPFVEVQITDQTSRHLEPMILDGDLDLALVVGEGIGAASASKKSGGSVSGADARTGAAARPGRERKNSRDPIFVREQLITDPICLCVSDSLLRSHLGDDADRVIAASIQGADLKNFRSLPFLLLQNRLGILIRRCFEEADYTPQVYLRAPYTQIITRIGLQGTAAFFSTRVALSSQADKLPADLHVFPLLYRGQPLFQEINLLYLRDRHIPRYALRFLELLRACFRDIEELPFEDADG